MAFGPYDFVLLIAVIYAGGKESFVSLLTHAELHSLDLIYSCFNLFIILVNGCLCLVMCCYGIFEDGIQWRSRNLTVCVTVTPAALPGQEEEEVVVATRTFNIDQGAVFNA